MGDFFFGLEQFVAGQEDVSHLVLESAVSALGVSDDAVDAGGIGGGSEEFSDR
jgi:hypothetical protein